MHARLEGEIARDMGRNFIQYWSFIKNDFANQKEARDIGVSHLKEQQRKLSRQLSKGLQNPGTKKYQPKSSLVPLKNRKSPFDDQSLDDDDSTLTKHMNKDNLLMIEESPREDNPATPHQNKKRRIFKSWQQSNAKIELEDLIKNLIQNEVTGSDEAIE